MKPYSLYAALTKAVDNYNERHHLNRGHLADALGYAGDNAARQLSNALNPNNSEKTISDHRKKLLFHAIDEEARMVFFTEWMRQWGLKPAKISAPTFCSVHEFSVLVDDAQMEADDAFKTAKMALRDETLSEDECKAIIKEATEAMRMQEEIIAKAHARLEKMRGEA